ncbi:2-phosphosulfolactate phosphatase [Desulfosporosinus youngiae]|uniref:Probable 2-phosphosulfolactate phosphatase n=1 Tax=Desulfosporosinus youngiae DSM 17734 TaxID=768710 RepID=H5XY15_9FIRM|nr:2-phosphosulfolactate phosphatase [Desulfosporosinus youngiae]EHQ91518.1 phosphosulfolactate phosphohydrolase-like enzyme [Desulfosporosinus youngiae DSM 17734]
MQIEVLPSTGSPRTPYLEERLVIVIDVLRATSTIVTALANGCQAIIPVLTPQEALERRLTLPGSLLGGERDSLIIEGFDLSNSPFDYVPEKVGGRRVILTTTNGTRAIRDSIAAPMIWMASFINMQSIVSAVLSEFETNKKLQGIVVYCAGTEERFDLADTLCAGMFIDALGPNVVLNDLGTAARMLYHSSEDQLVDIIRDSDHGKKLISLGLEKDLVYCATPNILPIVPVVQDGEIVWLTEQ